MNLAHCVRTVVVRLFLLACAGIVMQVGWTMVWAKLGNAGLQMRRPVQSTKVLLGTLEATS